MERKDVTLEKGKATGQDPPNVRNQKQATWNQNRDFNGP